MSLTCSQTMRPGLFQAVSRGHYKQTRYILESGLNPNIKGDDGYTALVQALHLENELLRDKMVKLLLRCGASVLSVDVTTGRDVLIWACALNRTQEVKRFVEQGRGGLVLNRTDNEGNTALHYAVRCGNIAITEVLCRELARFGIAVDVPNRDGFTPYLLACRHGYHECASMLVRVAHASKNQCDRKHFRSADYWMEVGYREAQKRQKQQSNGQSQNTGQKGLDDQTSMLSNGNSISDSEQGITNSEVSGKMGKTGRRRVIDNGISVKSSEGDENESDFSETSDILTFGGVTLPKLQQSTRLPALHDGLSGKLSRPPFPCSASLPQLNSHSSSMESLGKHAASGTRPTAASFPNNAMSLPRDHALSWLKPTSSSTPTVHFNAKASNSSYLESGLSHSNQKQRESVLEGLIPMLEILSSQRSTSYRRHVKPLPSDFRSLVHIIGMEAATIEFMKKPEEQLTYDHKKGKRNKNGRGVYPVRAMSKNSKSKMKVPTTKL